MVDEPEEVLPENVTLRDPGDFDAMRTSIYDGVKTAMEKSFPRSFGNYRMELHDTHYAGPETYDLNDQKKALLEDRYLARKLRGTVKLFDERTNSEIEARKISLMNVPHLTERGTFIHGGNEYTTINQARLLPGVYTRRQGNGELETQINPKPGSGRGFRIGFEPATAQYRMRIQQANLHLYSLLRDLGVPDDQLAQEWGPQILEQNRMKYDSRVFEKAYARLIHPREQNPAATKEEKATAIQQALDRIQVHEQVARQNLPNMFDATKSAEWRAGYEGQLLAEQFEKNAAEQIEFNPDLDPSEVAADISHWFSEEQVKEASFKPDLSAEDMRTEINSIVGKVGPRVGSMKQWPSSWLTPGNPLGWLSWYQKYSNGERGEEDDHHIMRWKRFKALQVPKFVANPTGRRAWALRNWAIDPEKLVPADQVGKLKEDMHNYREQAAEKWTQQKAASDDQSGLDEFMLCEFITKEAGLRPDRLKRLFRRQGKDINGRVFKHEDGSCYSHEEIQTYWEQHGLEKEAAASECIAVDLDGTLAERCKGPFDPKVIGEPVPEILEYVQGKLDDGVEVVIFTARAHTPSNIKYVKMWAKKHDLGDIEVTNKKHPRFTRFIDDRATAIIPDTGRTTHRKLASAVLAELLEAKRLSDDKQYTAKSAILAKLLAESPDDFEVDEDTHPYAGLHHRPTGFKIHSPRHIIPPKAFARHLRKEARLSYNPDNFERKRSNARKATGVPTSAAQAEAGNYPKGRFWWNGLQLALENVAGGMRRDWKNEPPKWTTKMRSDYGYVKLTESEADGDHMDVFLGPWLDSGVVYVVDQHRADGTFDEHKCMLGYTSEKEAREGYLAHYEKGWKGLKAITPLTVEQFKKWVKTGKTSGPMKGQTIA